MENYKFPSDSKIVSTDQVLINDLNNYNTLFGGVLMKKLIITQRFQLEDMQELKNVLQLLQIQ